MELKFKIAKILGPMIKSLKKILVDIRKISTLSLTIAYYTLIMIVDLEKYKVLKKSIIAMSLGSVILKYCKILSLFLGTYKNIIETADFKISWSEILSSIGLSIQRSDVFCIFMCSIITFLLQVPLLKNFLKSSTADHHNSHLYLAILAVSFVLLVTVLYRTYSKHRSFNFYFLFLLALTDFISVLNSYHLSQELKSKNQLRQKRELEVETCFSQNYFNIVADHIADSYSSVDLEEMDDFTKNQISELGLKLDMLALKNKETIKRVESEKKVWESEFSEIQNMISSYDLNSLFSNLKSKAPKPLTNKLDLIFNKIDSLLIKANGLKEKFNSFLADNEILKYKCSFILFSKMRNQISHLEKETAENEADLDQLIKKHQELIPNNKLKEVIGSIHTSKLALFQIFVMNGACHNADELALECKKTAHFLDSEGHNPLDGKNTSKISHSMKSATPLEMHSKNDASKTEPTGIQTENESGLKKDPLSSSKTQNQFNSVDKNNFTKPIELPSEKLINSDSLLISPNIKENFQQECEVLENMSCPDRKIEEKIKSPISVERNETKSKNSKKNNFLSSQTVKFQETNFKFEKIKANLNDFYNQLKNFSIDYGCLLNMNSFKKDFFDPNFDPNSFNFNSFFDSLCAFLENQEKQNLLLNRIFSLLHIVNNNEWNLHFEKLKTMYSKMLKSLEDWKRMMIESKSKRISSSQKNTLSNSNSTLKNLPVAPSKDKSDVQSSQDPNLLSYGWDDSRSSKPKLKLDEKSTENIHHSKSQKSLKNGRDWYDTNTFPCLKKDVVEAYEFFCKINKIYKKLEEDFELIKNSDAKFKFLKKEINIGRFGECFDLELSIVKEKHSNFYFQILAFDQLVLYFSEFLEAKYFTQIQRILLPIRTDILNSILAFWSEVVSFKNELAHVFKDLNQMHGPTDEIIKDIHELILALDKLEKAESSISTHLNDFMTLLQS